MAKSRPPLEARKPDFLQPAFDLAQSPKSHRPPRLPGADGEDGGGYARSSPEPMVPQPPSSARGTSPSPLSRRLCTTGASTPRAVSRGAASSSGGSAGSAGYGGLSSTWGSLGGRTTPSRPGTAGSPEMLSQGYIPMTEYVGIMALNKELREQNKQLRAELVNVQVSHEALRAEEAFLRSQMLKAGLEPPPEVLTPNVSGSDAHAS
eukprot:TRINITY_DN44533_c0_g1_i1.p1 TRINITY_DN44533_c0_g1~~TRINITY_DN44533_c0_g1_i1.p1  ORF type:complete len:206 (+),score=40.03 TRINITY_DN44533_c0_g1_i1:33-650(+)